MPCARPSTIELKICASSLPYNQSTSRRLGPIPPPARPPWHPEQLNRTNNCRPSPIAVRSFVYGLLGFGALLLGPGIGPTLVNIGGGAAVAPPCGGASPHALVNASEAIQTSETRVKV